MSLTELFDDLARLQAENAKLKAALEKYGYHMDSCLGGAIISGNEWSKCTCGYDEALEGDSDG